MRIIVSCMSRALLQFRFLKLLKYIILSFMMYFEYTMHVVSLWEKWMGVYNIYVSYPHSTLKEVCIHCLTVLLSFKRQNQPYSKPTDLQFQLWISELGVLLQPQLLHHDPASYT